MVPLSPALLPLLLACADPPSSSSDTSQPSQTLAADTDGDSIADVHEGSDDADGDGQANRLDLDSDGDGIDDAVEAGDDDLDSLPFDTDRDGVPDFLDLDSDGNCLPDADEASDLDGDGLLDAHDLDDDNDGLSDLDEELDCAPVDSDGDGTPDYQDADSDNDGVSDAQEGGQAGGPVDHDGDGVPDHLDDDSDGDGIPDSEEGGGDVDGDGLTNAQDADSDGDGIDDDEELELGTDPDDRDSDDDGFTDLAELVLGSDPLSDEEPSGSDVVQVELPARNEIEWSLDYELDLRRPDLVMIMDTTTSMSAVIAPAIGDLMSIAESFVAESVEAQLGVAVFQEYAALPMSGGNDVPFRLEQQLTGNFSAASSALSGLSIHAGGNIDWPEASMEALYQALTGVGYDLSCDTVYDDTTDVLPFLSSADDPFGGLAGQAWDPTDSTTGTIGGMGFREASQPILLLVTDADMRDPDAGYEVPGGCPGEAGSSDVIAAANELGATLIGLDTAGLATDQMIDLAEATGSFYDPGTGSLEPLVFDYSAGDEDTVALLTEIIDEIGQRVELEQLAMVAVDDPHDFVVEIGPTYDNVGDLYSHGDILPFVLTLRGVLPPEDSDAAYVVELEVQGDGVAVQQLTLVIVVPWG